jgi:hypothetical protein
MAIDALIEMNLVEVISVGITQLQKVKQKEMTKITNTLQLGNTKVKISTPKYCTKKN